MTSSVPASPDPLLRGPVTLAPVARLAGVFKMTASNVVNHKPGMTEANPAARVLAGRRTGRIGILAPRCETPYVNGLRRGAVIAAEDAGVSLAVCTTRRWPPKPPSRPARSPPHDAASQDRPENPRREETGERSGPGQPDPAPGTPSRQETDMTDAEHPTGTLSVQMYTFRDAAGADQSATVARVAALGFRYVEPFGLGSSGQSPAARMKAATALRRDLDDHGLRLSSVHAAAPHGPQADAILDELEVIGAALAVVSWPGEVHGFTRDALATLEGTRRFAGAMNEAARRAAARGLRLGYHNHWWEWNTLENGRAAYDTLLDLLDPGVFLEVDTYWAHTAGQDPAGVLRRLGGRALALHLKDGPATPEAAQVPLGEGVVDYRAAILAAPAARWHVLEMDHSAGDVFAEVGRSARRLVEGGLSTWEGAALSPAGARP